MRVDGIGNLRAFEPPDGRPLLLLGSHLDTVREAGRFDGPLGVIAGLACIEAASFARPYRLGVVGFGDEEGVRFGTAYLGSDVLAGRPFDAAQLALTDVHGITLAQAIRDFGGDPDALAADRLDPAAEGGLLGYVEVHIEQGPVLENAGLPVGVVSAIQGQSRFAFRFEGQAGHAGTIPMPLRRDALTAAAEFVVGVEAAPGRKPVSWLRSANWRSAPARSTSSRARCPARSMSAAPTTGSASAPVSTCTPWPDAWRPTDTSRWIGNPCRNTPPRLVIPVSAPGSRTPWPPPGSPCSNCPAARVTTPSRSPRGCRWQCCSVRCRGGLSHHPLESVAAEDVAAALKVMDNFLRLLAQSPAL